MKKFGIFFLGFLTGVCLTILTLVVISKITTRDNDGLNSENVSKYFNNQEYKNIDGLNISSEYGDVFDAERIVMFQTLNTDCALAYLCNDSNIYHNHSIDDTLSLFVSDNKNVFLYDDKMIDVDENSEVVQVGTYRYKTINKEYDQYKTVPVVIIRETSNINDIT